MPSKQHIVAYAVNISFHFFVNLHITFEIECESTILKMHVRVIGVRIPYSFAKGNEYYFVVHII